MAKPKKKIRADFRKNRAERARSDQWTQRFSTPDEEAEDDVRRDERISGKGDLARKRTVIGDPTDSASGLGVHLEIDETVCLPGRVLNVYGLASTVAAEDGTLYHCTTRRLLKTLSTDQRHVVAAGDRVWIRPSGLDEGVIERVEPRHGVLARESRGRQHILVTNVDQVVIVASAAEPTLKPNLIDRFLITAHQAGLRPLVAINKADLVDVANLMPLVGVYSQLGYAVLVVSATTGLGMDRLRREFAGRASVIAGQSGVGKSSLLNAIDPTLHLAVRAVSTQNQKGRHTTTTAQLLPMAAGGYVVDTPGIRQFQPWDVIPAEVAGYFRDLRPFVHRCRYPNCTHIHESDCAVKNAVADGRLDARRYESYCNLFWGTPHERSPGRNRHAVTELNRTQSVVQESALLVGVLLPDRPIHDDPLAELCGLAETAGARVVGTITQRRERPDVTTYLGKGKVSELKQMVEATDADVILFDNDLSPAQTRNLEQAAGTKVLDRSELILDIFASRARTVEARLAVELAQLQYSLPRLKRMWTHLSRLKMGIGMRGPGEKQLEVDRRLVEKRISELRRDLKTIELRKERAVAARSDRMSVSLVGYTNAGKSTLMNALTDAGVLAENKLFATLDTRTRRWQLPGWGPVLLSDTVGFIRDLPHNLIASFKATLEESRQADLLLHVADVSSPQALDQISAVYGVLEELGIEAKDTLLLLNKVDAADAGQLSLVRTRYPHALPISARAGIGLDELSAQVSQTLSHGFLDIDVETGVANGRLLAQLAAYGEILSKRYSEERVVVHCRVPRRSLAHLHGTDVTIRPHAQTPTPIGSNGYHQMAWDWQGLDAGDLSGPNGTATPAPPAPRQ